tara:strand:- start:516 stop:824 length:309 start_codon:yes stop_codon:yes gene_type:complete
MKKFQRLLERLNKFTRSDRNLHDTVANLKESIENTIKTSEKKEYLISKAKKAAKEKNKKEYFSLRKKYGEVSKKHSKNYSIVKYDIKKFRKKFKKMIKYAKI